MSRFIFLLLFWLPVAAFAQSNPKTLIGQRTFTFHDSGRRRPVTTEIWYPTTEILKKTDQAFSPIIRQYTVRDAKPTAGKYPLIMLSHGTGGGRLTLEWLAQALVQNGFIVAAVDHYGNTYDHKIPLEFLNFWNRPLDISFAITNLLQHPEIKPVIDAQKIGATGFSLGGYTVIALAGGQLNYQNLTTYLKTTGRKELEIPELPGLARYLDDSTLLTTSLRPPELKDSRIKAFFAIAPALGAGFTAKNQFNQVNKPVYLVGVQSDSIAPVKTNARHYHQLLASSQYYELPGKTGHYVMLNEANDEMKKAAPIYFADDASVNRQQVHAQVAALASNFFKNNLK
ncbi:dienelactone hydrolase [Adhaeribacter swui]|uniref:Dienelactone hydrolase n=1 Tax=Adhaeribacter swui TaxID=2086471 RepID=A0A7G7GAW9_9BACT|nr:dienelactone hydrolase [Adhaeribacter swui]QNF34303.1 dienelactone hydrolase [Adhaeribacter swui]